MIAWQSGSQCFNGASRRSKSLQILADRVFAFHKMIYFEKLDKAKAEDVKFMIWPINGKVKMALP